METLLRFHTSEAVAPVSAVLDHWDARGSSCPACRSDVPSLGRTCCHLPVSPMRRWEDAGPSTARGWRNHRKLLQCEGFIQLLLAASMSLPGHGVSSALLWVLEVLWYGTNTVLHPRSSWVSPAAPQHCFSAADPLPFSPQGFGDLSELCAHQPTARCGSRVDGPAGRHGQRWQGVGWRAGGRQGSSRAPHLVTQYFQKQAGRKRKTQPCEGPQQCLATVKKCKGREVSISLPGSPLSLNSFLGAQPGSWMP